MPKFNVRYVVSIHLFNFKSVGFMFSYFYQKTLCGLQYKPYVCRLDFVY